MYGWEMSQKLAVYGFEWVKNISQFNEDIIENYNEDSNKGYFLEVDVQYPEKKLNGLHNDLPFLPEILKIEKAEKLLANLHDKKEYVIHKGNLKQALNPKSVLEKVHRGIKFNQKAWLKPYINMNKANKNAKGDLDFLQFHV